MSVLILLKKWWTKWQPCQHDVLFFSYAQCNAGMWLRNQKLAFVGIIPCQILSLFSGKDGRTDNWPWISGGSSWKRTDRLVKAENSHAAPCRGFVAQWLVTKNPKDHGFDPPVGLHCVFFFHLIHPSGLLSLSEKRERLWLWLRNVHGHSAWATSRLAWRKAVVPLAQTRWR